MRPKYPSCAGCENKGVARWGCPACGRKRPLQPKVMSLDDRFWAKVVEQDGCMIWKGAIDRCGYGCFGFDKGLMRRAHRVSWFLIYGEWPSLTLDHLCRRRRCVDPTHLENVTIGDNLRRAPRNNVCVRGHELKDPNLYYYGPPKANGLRKRRCLACTKREWDARKKEA